MRGTHVKSQRQCNCIGIIPAYAGNTRSVDHAGNKSGDHPRVCGEHFYSRCHACGARGSSPRMRGTHQIFRHVRGKIGIIPAYAGNTLAYAVVILHRKDHPRVCGEHPSPIIAARRTMGSSPRMRGTPMESVLALSHLGIIPAYAGNTDNLTVNRVHPWDHPRVCGEHEAT